MSQSLLYHAFGVREGCDYQETLYEDGCIRFVLSVRPDWLRCPACDGRDIVRKGRRFRELQTVPIGLKPVFLVTEVPKCQCAACGKRFEAAPPFAPAYVRYTRRLQAFVEDLSGRMTISDLAAITGLGWDTVKDIVKARLEKDCGHPRLKELKRLSIDEIYVGRRRKFYTLVIDLDSGRIVWVAHGRGGDSLRKFWRALRLRQARIEAVSMDMSPAYWSAVLEHLPEAAIVFDRCHITKLVNEKLDDLRRAMVREATGLMKQSVKGVRYLLLMRRDNVDESRLSPYISNIRQLQSGAASDQPVLPYLSSFNDGATSQNAPSFRWASSHKSASHLV